MDPLNDLRIIKPGPTIPYKGQFVQSLVYYQGNSDLHHSWDVVLRGFNMSRANEQELALRGWTPQDLNIVNQRIKAKLYAQEGRLMKYKWEDETGWKRFTTYCDYLLYEASWFERIIVIGGPGLLIGFLVRSWTG